MPSPNQSSRSTSITSSTITSTTITSTIPTLDKPSLQTAAEQLARIDPVLQRALQSGGPPKLWKRPVNYATFVRIILEQQVSLASAWNTYERLRQRCPGRRVTPAAVADLGIDTLKSCGFSRQKARYTATLADQCIARHFRIGPLSKLPDDEVREQIVAQLGMGNWTADMFLMLALCRPDIFPVGDLAVVKGYEQLSGESLSTDQLVQRAQRWRPHRSVATRMIWCDYLQRKGTKLPGT